VGEPVKRYERACPATWPTSTSRRLGASPTAEPGGSTAAAPPRTGLPAGCAAVTST